MDFVDATLMRLASLEGVGALLDDAALRHLMEVAWGTMDIEVELSARADMYVLVERLEPPPAWDEPVVADLLWRGVVTVTEGETKTNWPLCVPVLITEDAGPREAMARVKALRDAAARAGLARSSSAGRSGGLAPTWLAPEALFDDPDWGAGDPQNATLSKTRRRDAALAVARAAFAREGLAILIS